MVKICQQCKKKDDRCYVNSKRYNKAGKLKKNYMCPKCNTERLRKYRQTERGKEVFREMRKRQYKKHRKKCDARSKLNQAVRSGLIIKPKLCTNCKKKKKLEGHHEDYNKPFEVIWYCRQCYFKCG